MERMLTRTELAERLAVSPWTVDRMAARGEIRVHRVGGAPRYLWSEVVEDTAQESMTDDLAVNRALRRV